LEASAEGREPARATVEVAGGPVDVAGGGPVDFELRFPGPRRG